MKKLKHVIEEIMQLTNTINVDYPELYVFLDEEPITIPATKYPEITVSIMQDYIDNLKQQIKHYSKTHKTN